jgi:hypothetical protein
MLEVVVAYLKILLEHLRNIMNISVRIASTMYDIRTANPHHHKVRYKKKFLKYCDVHALGVAVDVAWKRTRTQQWLLQQWENCVFYGSDPRKCFLRGPVSGYTTRGSLPRVPMGLYTKNNHAGECQQ